MKGAIRALRNACRRMTRWYGKPLRMDGEEFSSTKHQGKGIGLYSMKSITDVYDGIFEAGNNDGEFFVNIVMKY